MAFIETEMTKRRGQAEAEAVQSEKPESFDPEAELYQIVEKYRLDNAKENEEGNVTNSMGMLTMIPEVDLGME
jgi:hypothetical protein